MMLQFNKDHVARVRSKTQSAEGLGPFWKSMMLGALDAIDDLRSRYDRYGLALMMIREGVADPKEVAAKALDRAALTAPPALRVSEEMVEAVENAMVGAIIDAGGSIDFKAKPIAHAIVAALSAPAMWVLS